MEDIKEEWFVTLEELRRYKSEYEKLISDLKELRKQVKKGKVKFVSPE